MERKRKLAQAFPPCSSSCNLSGGGSEANDAVNAPKYEVQCAADLVFHTAELVTKIFGLLDIKALVLCGAVCKSWKVVSESRYIWKPLVQSLLRGERTCLGNLVQLEDDKEILRWKHIYKGCFLLFASKGEHKECPVCGALCLTKTELEDCELVKCQSCMFSHAFAIERCLECDSINSSPQLCSTGDANIVCEECGFRCPSCGDLFCGQSVCWRDDYGTCCYCFENSLDDHHNDDSDEESAKQ